MDKDSDGDPALIDRFVRRHYRLAGTLRLHRHAIGLDLLRAPVNTLLAPALLLARLVAVGAHLLRLRRLSRLAGGLRLQLRSDVGAALEAHLLSDLLLPRRPGGDGTQTPMPTETTRRLIGEYVALRGAVSEIGTALVVLAVGVLLFRAVTPGVLSLAPVVAEHVAHARDVAGFPLGEWLGRAWYAVFPGDRPPSQVLAVGAGLVLGLSLVTACSGILTDPILARLGIHRRRLRRLLRRIDRAAEDPAGIEPEVVLARGADIVDLANMVIRSLRP